MTLSGKGDPRARREDAKDYRRDVDARRPWIRWLLVGAAVVVVAGVVVWELLARSGRFSEILLPSPGAVWVEFLRLSAGPDLWPNYFVTLRRLFLSGC